MSDVGRHHGPAGTRAGRRHGGEGRRALAPFAGAALALALLAGCGDGGQEAPEQEPPAETTAQDETDGTASEEETDSGEEADPTDESTAPEGDDPTDPPPGDEPSSDAPTDPPTSEDPPEEEPTDDSPSGENLFEGTWGFGHDSKVLSAEELSALLEQEAEARGPEEMSLSVECGDGVDTGAGDDTAECIAYADEGVEHLWAITVGPADAGLEIEVENIG